MAYEDAETIRSALDIAAHLGDTETVRQTAHAVLDDRERALGDLERTTRELARAWEVIAAITLILDALPESLQSRETADA
jgi:hypothetical protein